MATRQSDRSLEQVCSTIGVERAGPVEYPMVSRRARALASTSEPFETLRDLLRAESRLRLTPPDPWRPERQTATERSWSGRGHIVRLQTPGVCDDWTLLVDGTAVLEDASRRAAFETAAERMREITEHTRE